MMQDIGEAAIEEDREGEDKASSLPSSMPSKTHKVKKIK